MTKIEEVKVETIEDTKQLKGTETIETIYPETIDLPTYDYWKSQNTIDANISIRNIPEKNNNIVVKTWTYTANWTWLLTVNLPFTPKLIKFTFFPDTTWVTWSDWQITNSSQTCLSRKYTLDTQAIQQEFRTTEAFYVQEFVSSSQCSWNINIISNGFTIQANSNTFSINLKRIAECFW